MRALTATLLLLFMLGGLGCKTAQTLTSRTPLYKYRADIRLSTVGKSVQGMLSVPRAEPTAIKIDSPVKMDLVRLSTCNRDWTIEKVGNSGGWFGKSSNTYTFNFEPTEVEREGFCPLYVQVFDEGLLTAWGFVAFKTTEKLKAKIDCDGESYTAEGVDSCQGMFGFEHGLKFERDVKYTFRGPCDVKRKDPLNYRVRTTGPGFCAVSFFDGTDFFKFILLGYDEILVRGKQTTIRTDFGGGL